MIQHIVKKLATAACTLFIGFCLPTSATAVDFERGEDLLERVWYEFYDLDPCYQLESVALQVGSLGKGLTFKDSADDVLPMIEAGRKLNDNLGRILSYQIFGSRDKEFKSMMWQKELAMRAHLRHVNYLICSRGSRPTLDAAKRAILSDRAFDYYYSYAMLSEQLLMLEDYADEIRLKFNRLAEQSYAAQAHLCARLPNPPGGCP